VYLRLASRPPPDIEGAKAVPGTTALPCVFVVYVSLMLPFVLYVEYKTITRMGIMEAVEVDLDEDRWMEIDREDDGEGETMGWKRMWAWFH
jgi:amino acid permease